MSTKRIFKKGQKFSDWTLTSYLGGGGNGEVWTCQNSKGESQAIKLLKKIKPKSYTRFTDETTIIEKNSEIDGLIPIKEKHLPKKLDGEVPFYIMPLAETAEKKLVQKTIEDKVSAILQVAETLSSLHNRKIYHRDIKPDNILFYNSRYCLVDFGLVDYPNKKEVSLNNEVIGPKWTMAPEMRRESSTADASKADIYSLAKTLWIFLTDRKKGFDGQYSTESIIDLKKFYPQSYTSPIDNLLISSTDNDPTKRPSIDEFIEKLREWQNLSEDFHRRNQQQWFEIQTRLFPASIPTRVIWEDINDIIKVLKIVCSFEALNHLFFPDGGGLDLEDVRISHEAECIELDFQLIEIVKPKRLIFESFGFNPEWNYFRLETNELEPSGANETKEGDKPYNEKHDHELVTQVYPGHYEHYQYLENSYYRAQDDPEYERPEGMRQVTRRFRGSFVIFNKRSVYNLTSSTYDGRHNTMTTDEFREYIQKSVDIRKAREKKINNYEDPATENRRREHAERVKQHFVEQIVYICGYCGDIVDSNGNKLDSHEREYNMKVIDKFGDSVVHRVHGKCCRENYL